MKRTLCILTTLALALATVTTGLAEKPAGDKPAGKKGQQGRGHRNPGNMPLLPPRLADKLDLTEDQQKKIDELSEEWTVERDQWLKENKGDGSLREQMKAAREADDKEKMKEIRDQVREKIKPLHEIRRGYMEQVKGLLTDDQEAKMAEAHQRRQERRKGGRKGEAGREGPPAEKE